MGAHCLARSEAEAAGGVCWSCGVGEGGGDGGGEEMEGEGEGRGKNQENWPCTMPWNSFNGPCSHRASLFHMREN